MPKNPYLDLLSHVQKPSQYLGSEINRIQKDHRQVRLKFALAFPDLYEIGTSHFGLQILYHLLNQDNDIAAERVFAPGEDMEALLRQRGLGLASLESQTPLADFDILGFSLLYELNYTNVLNMIDLAGLPLQWSRREDHHPLVIAGGPCVCNPEPMADFFDAMVFGDGEQLVQEMARVWLDWQSRGRGRKTELLQRWSRLEGVYVPRFYDARYDDAGFQELTPAPGQRQTVSRAILPDLNEACFPEAPIIPFGKPVHDRLRMEISRGCSRGCRFCQAGMIYRPVRERSAQNVYDLVQAALAQTGYEDLSLLSLSTGDYSCLSALMEKLMQRCQTDQVAISLPSLRAGSLTPRLMELIRSVRKTGFTIAPEAGSQRLRDVINKNITFEDIAGTVEDAFALGWKVIKLYFMIGLPTETEEDLDAIVEMVRRLKQIKGPQRRRSQINVSVTTFIPKPHTPFQWCRQITLDESKAKVSYLKSKLSMPGVRLKWQLPEMSMLEGVLARGDRRLSGVVEQAWKNGARFDGWTDRFDLGLWRQAFDSTRFDPASVTSRERDVAEPLPWAHMHTGVDSDFFKEQWQAALAGESLDDCRHGDCHQCGVCDFEALRPQVLPEGPVTRDVAPAAREDTFLWLELTYQKMGQARFFGHLELSNLVIRAVRRARIQVKYSKGFHPMPKISFDDPLPLGMEGEAEQMRMMVSPLHTCQEVLELLNVHLPEGLRFTRCRVKPSGKRAGRVQRQCFRVHLQQVPLDAERLARFWQSETWPYIRKNRKGRTHEFDLRQLVRRLEFENHQCLYAEIQSSAPQAIRPADLLQSIFDLPPEQLPGIRMVKLVCGRQMEG